MLKKCSKMESTALKTLMLDILKPHVPEFKREVETDGECTISHFTRYNIYLIGFSCFCLTSNRVC